MAYLSISIFTSGNFHAWHVVGVGRDAFGKKSERDVTGFATAFRNSHQKLAAWFEHLIRKRTPIPT